MWWWRLRNAVTEVPLLCLLPLVVWQAECSRMWLHVTQAGDVACVPRPVAEHKIMLQHYRCQWHYTNPVFINGILKYSRYFIFMVVLHFERHVLAEMFAEKYIKTCCFQMFCCVQVRSEDQTVDEMLKPSWCQLSDEEVTPRDSPSHHGSSDGTTSPCGYRGKREAPPYRDPPGPVSPVQRTLPPYRDPPPPVSSPARSMTPRTPGPSLSQDNRSDILSSSPSSSGKMKTKRNLLKVCADLQLDIWERILHENFVLEETENGFSIDSVYCLSSHLLPENINIQIYKLQFYHIFCVGVKLGL
jgi:hypothetical protein